MDYRTLDEGSCHQVFTLIAENNVAALRDLLIRSPDSAMQRLSTGDWTTLHLAASFGRVDIIHILVDHGMDVNVRSGTHQLTPLHQGTLRDDLETTIALLDIGADIDAVTSRDSHSCTALRMAVSFYVHDRKKTWLDRVNFLLKRGANYMIDSDGGEPSLSHGFLTLYTIYRKVKLLLTLIFQASQLFTSRLKHQSFSKSSLTILGQPQL